MTLNFAVTGCGGYIAPRHLQAIRDVGGSLVAAMDPNDSVGVLDRYFQDVHFFREFERYDDYLARRFGSRSVDNLDYVAICSPNFLHAAHIAAAMRQGASAICEKPLVLSPEDLDYLAELEQISGKKVFTVLQLRLLPDLIELKKKMDADNRQIADVELSYITKRGPWYSESWKGVDRKSGGICANIGIHFFDLLTWLFGKPSHKELHLATSERVAGYMELEKARVKWFLSVDHRDLPSTTADSGKPAYRSLKMDGEEIEFSEGFTELHTVMYRKIIAGDGFGIEHARAAIELVNEIRGMKVVAASSKIHPLVKR